MFQSHKNPFPIFNACELHHTMELSEADMRIIAQFVGLNLNRPVISVELELMTTNSFALLRSRRIQSHLTDPAALDTVGCRITHTAAMYNFTHTHSHPSVVLGASPITRGYHHRGHFGANRGDDYLHRFALDLEYAFMVHGRPGRTVFDRTLPHGRISSSTSNPAVKRVERTPTNGWKILMAEGAMQYIPRREFEVPEMGKWTPEPMRSPSLASVVVYGVPEDLDESHVATCLVQGSEEVVKPRR